MTRFTPPYLVIVLLSALALVYLMRPFGLTLRQDGALPWYIPLILGLGALSWPNIQFSRIDTEIHTFQKPRILVTDGLFRYSRNPMYLGFLLILISAAIFVNTWPALLMPACFWIVAQFWYIPFEERNLRAEFGVEYEEYAQNVRRWI